MDGLEDYILVHSSQLYGYLLQHTGNHYTAEDLLQETFLKAYLAIQAEIPDNLEAWLLTIAKYTMYDYFRKQKRIVIQEADFFDKQVYSVELADELIQKETSEQIVALLKRLPSNQQKAIALVQIKEFSYEEVSEMLDIPINTVKSHVKRGRATLRKLAADS